jgi:predicted alpha-1,6-mannanase (GH76 family)
VIRGQSGGDGGLFAAILARYLALAARALPDPEASVARSLVLTSAEACWSGASSADDGPVFSAFWDRPAPPSPLPEDAPERDMSVQVGGWMLLEAAATLSPDVAGD